MKRSYSFFMLLILSMVFNGTIVISSIEVQATSKTQSEALQWVKSQVGKPIDMDGVPIEQPYQCVDLIKAYYNYLGVSPVTGNGKDYATNTLPSGWSRIQGASPQLGDILVYSGNQANPYGHVAIYESNNSTYHQNFENHPYVERITYAYNGIFNPYWGVIRPNFSNTQLISDGDFVMRPDGHVARIVGGAPIWVSDWKFFGGQKPCKNISVAQFDALPKYPAVGTLISSAQTGCVYRIMLGGCFYYINSWDHLGGPKPTTVVDDIGMRKDLNCNPIGSYDLATGGVGTVRVRGWAFHNDVARSSLLIHVYIGGQAGDKNAIGYSITANTLRTDVNDVYSGVGNNHGFDSTITTSKRGTQDVYVYAIASSGALGGENVLLGKKTINITNPTETSIPSPSPTANPTTKPTAQPTVKPIITTSPITTIKPTVTPSLTPTVTVKPKTPKNIKAKKKAKTSVKITWKQVSEVNGYEIHRTIKKNKGFKRIATIEGASKTSFINKKLKRKVKYYYQVRTYKMIDNKKIYSEYSLIKGIKL